MLYRTKLVTQLHNYTTTTHVSLCRMYGGPTLSNIRSTHTPRTITKNKFNKQFNSAHTHDKICYLVAQRTISLTERDTKNRKTGNVMCLTLYIVFSFYFGVYAPARIFMVYLTTTKR